jgi:tight adherence protein C
MGPNAAANEHSLVYLLSLSSLLMGMAVFLLGWYVTTLVTSDRGDGARWATFETSRRQALRRASRIYRWFEPLVDDLAAHYGHRRAALRQRIERGLDALIDQPPWTAPEWLAVHRLKTWCWTLGLGLVVGWFCWPSPGLTALALAFCVLVWITTARQFVVSLEKRADAIRGQVRFRLPFAIDLLQLILKAGSSFLEALETLVRQTSGSALASHLAIVLQEIERGIPRSEALGHFEARLGMDEVQELIFALRQGDELGTPLTQILESQAYQLRNRQAQAIEKAAEESKIKLAGPCTLIMIACIISMLGPWILKVFHDYQGMFL